jgi:hypothetical protein
MKTPLSLLRSFAKQRERAYRMHNCFNQKRAQAIAKIKKLSDYWAGLPPEKQLNIVRQCKSELLTVLPSAESRFKNQREQILELINE